jgi:hypothetical protein
MPEFEDIYYNGFRSLSESEKLDAKVREEGTGEAGACPGCGHQPFSRRCLACGFEKATQALEDTSVGEMREIRIGKKLLAADDFDLWRQVCGYARARSKPEKQPGRAANLFRNITGRWPPREFVFGLTESAPITRNTQNKIKSLDIAWRKGREKPQAEIALT